MAKLYNIFKKTNYISKFDMTSYVLPFLKTTKKNSLVGKHLPYIWTHRLRFYLSREIKQIHLFPFIQFKMISEPKLNFELHPHIHEIHTEIFVYKKCVLITHIKAPAILKVKFTDL